MEKLVYKDKILYYKVIRTNKKKEFYSFNIENDIVYFTVPEYATDKDIKMVLKQQFFILYYKIHPEERYVIHYFGKKYMVKCSKSKTDKVIVKDNEIQIKASNITSSYFRKVLYSFYTKSIEEELEKLIVQARIDFKEIDIPNIIIKPIKGYLGYNYQDHIEISPIIAKFDKKFIKVLLYHEICHSIVRGHPKEFYDVLASKLENGLELNKIMNETKFNDYL